MNFLVSGATSLMALNKKDFTDFLNSSGKAAAIMVSSSIEVATYYLRRLCKEITRIAAFSFEIARVVGSFFRISGRLSPFSTWISLSSLPVADAIKIAYNCSLLSAA